jgi:hypothetical protein
VSMMRSSDPSGSGGTAGGCAVMSQRPSAAFFAAS